MSAILPDDPVTSDPSPVDWEFPPAIVEVKLRSHGENMNGIIYLGQGKGPHPTVILLHGYPGNEKNLDLAQAIRRAGWNALFFHYRGAWGSGGAFSMDHALEDVQTAFDYVQLPQTQNAYRMDAGQVALVGHSMGADLALLAGAHLPTIQNIIAIAPANLGHMLASMNLERRAVVAESLEMMGYGAINRAGGPEQFVVMGDHPNRYDVLENLSGLDGKQLLFVTAARDEDTPPAYRCDPIVQGLLARRRSSVSVVTLDTDHVFSTARIALARAVIHWLQGPRPSGAP